MLSLLKCSPKTKVHAIDDPYFDTLAGSWYIGMEFDDVYQCRKVKGLPHPFSRYCPTT